MNLEKMKNRIADLGNQIGALASTIGDMQDTAEMEKATARLSDMQRQMNMLKSAYDAAIGEQANGLGNSPAPTGEERTLRDMRESREYARAFASAIRNGVRPGRDRDRYDERLKVLYDAMTIAGGNPAGEDGGFLVPEDVENMIREKRRALNPLAELFSYETVNTQTGWRVTDTAPTTGFTKLASEIPSAGIQSDDQPTFAKVSYSLDTYGLFIPVSQELASDEDANLFGYLSGWFAKKQVITENTLLLNLLRTLTPTTVTSDYTSKIGNTLNVTLDPEIAANAAIITNQNGFDLLDGLVDANGRPLLQRDLAAKTPYMFKGLPVKVMSNAMLPDVSSHMPMFIGDFREFGTLFTRQGLEMVSTDVGGQAFRTYSIEVRGVCRMDAQKFDAAAAAYLKLQ